MKEYSKGIFNLQILLLYGLSFVFFAWLYQSGNFRNPAFMFFLPSISAMIWIGKRELPLATVNAGRLAAGCGVFFAILTIICVLLFQYFFEPLKNESLVLPLIFIGNLFFPILTFPAIERAHK